MFSKNFLEDPVLGRKEKPRKSGLTMVLDKGLGLSSLDDLLRSSADYIDFIKLTFGTALLYPEDLLREKILNIRKAEVDIYTGGTLFEIAVSQNKIEEYLIWLKHLNFTAVEISDGTIELSNKKRKETIELAGDMGFVVLTEVGKKDKKVKLSTEEIIEKVNFDFDSGADGVIIEARESGKNVSIYSDTGEVDLEIFKIIKNSLANKLDRIIWEAPLKKQQVFFIDKLGNNVSLGNISTDDVIALEGLRRGLRGDTFAKTI